VLRSLIPMGCMPMFGPRFSVGLMLCEGYAPVLHQPMADPSGRDSPAQQNHSACPYGASPVFAGAPALAAVSLALGLPPEPALPVPQLTAPQSISRAQSPRAPPIRS